MSVSKEELVELIENEDAKLSPEGRELWEKLELMYQSAPEEATPATMPPPSSEELETIQRMAYLPGPDQEIIQRITHLHEGHYSAEFAEKRGRPGGPIRDRTVIRAASVKDRAEGRQIDPDMTPEQAVARLREPG